MVRCTRRVDRWYWRAKTDRKGPHHDAIVVAVPIYVYDTNAAIKNFVDLSGRAWTDKPVGFLCAAGGPSSYMAILGLANSLMLDFRCLIVPRFTGFESYASYLFSPEKD